MQKSDQKWWAQEIQLVAQKKKNNRKEDNPDNLVFVGDGRSLLDLWKLCAPLTTTKTNKNPLWHQNSVSNHLELNKQQQQNNNKLNSEKNVQMGNRKQNSNHNIRSKTTFHCQNIECHASSHTHSQTQNKLYTTSSFIYHLKVVVCIHTFWLRGCFLGCWLSAHPWVWDMSKTRPITSCLT